MAICSILFEHFSQIAHFRFAWSRVFQWQNVLKAVHSKVVFLVQFCSQLWSMIYRALFRPRLHCTLMISVFGKVGPTSNNSNTSVRNLSPKSSIGQSGFKISASKTVAVLFTKKTKPRPIKSVFQSTTIPLRKEYKYLGVPSKVMASITHIYSTFLTNVKND